MKKVGVFGIGNVLIGDDAIGPTVVTLLDALWEFPEGVVVEDLGTPSLSLAGRMAEFDAVILVDAVSASLPPGTIKRYTLDEMLRHPPSLRLSPHDPSLKETLLTVQFAGDGPSDVVLIGVVPKSLDQFGLSPEVESAAPAAAQAVIDELARLGITARRSSAVTAPAPWWHAA